MIVVFCGNWWGYYVQKYPLIVCQLFICLFNICRCQFPPFFVNYPLMFAGVSSPFFVNYPFNVCRCQFPPSSSSIPLMFQESSWLTFPLLFVLCQFPPLCHLSLLCLQGVSFPILANYPFSVSRVILVNYPFNVCRVSVPTFFVNYPFNICRCQFPHLGQQSL